MRRISITGHHPIIYVVVAMIVMTMCVWGVVLGSKGPGQESEPTEYFSDIQENVITGFELLLPAGARWQSCWLKADRVAVERVNFSGVNSGISSIVKIDNFQIDLVGLVDVSEPDSGEEAIRESGRGENLFCDMLDFSSLPEIRKYCGLDLRSVSEMRISDLDLRLNDSSFAIRRINASVAQASALSGNIELSGVVKIENSTGDMLYCNRCNLDIGQRELVVDGDFQYKSGSVVRRGTGGRFDFELKAPLRLVKN